MLSLKDSVLKAEAPILAELILMQIMWRAIGFVQIMGRRQT
jgi:hypothetical protein